MRRLAALLVVWGVLGGGFIGISTSGISVVQPASGSSHTITVTFADNGHNYKLSKGSQFDVQLSTPSGLIWTEPASSNQAVFQRTGGSSGTTAMATFTAVAKGKAKVTATGSPNCSGGGCPLFLLLFQVTVSVVG